MSIWNDLVLYNKVAKCCQCLCHAYIFSLRDHYKEPIKMHVSLSLLHFYSYH